MSVPAFTLTVEELDEHIERAMRKVLPSAAAAALPEILTRDQAAALLHIHRNVLTRWVKQHGVPGRKLGGEWRFLRSELVEWLTKQERAV